MINIKSPQEIEKMKIGGKILSDVLWEVTRSIEPGVSEIELDRLAEKLILEKGGESGFKKVEGYKYTICVSTNDAVVHGIPSEYKLKDGDLIGIDCGVFYEGFHTDIAETVVVGSKIDQKTQNFLEAGREALNSAIKEARVGSHVGNISKTIQDILEAQGNYSIVRTLVGHGVGKELHEEPEIPGFLVGNINKTPILSEGMTIAIEAIYSMGKSDLVLDNDGWTLRTEDGSLGGLFERSIAITKNGPLILTP